MDRIVIIGAGGHAKVVIEAIRSAKVGTIVGLIDPNSSAQSVLGVPILGGDEILPDLFSQGTSSAVIALGNNANRHRISKMLMAKGFSCPTIVHPTAYISPSARVGAGVVVMAGAVIGTESRIDDLSIINTSAVVDHDCWIGEAVHVAPGCALAGNVWVGDRTLIGVGSSVRPGIRIGADCTIGAGSAVVSEVPAGATVGGAPARPLRLRSPT